MFDEEITAGNHCYVGITADEPVIDANGNIVYEADNKTIKKQPIDLTGATVKWILKKHARDNSYLVFKTTNDGGISVFDPTSGKFTVNLVPDDTKDLDGEFYCEAEVIDSTGHETTLKSQRETPGWYIKINTNGIRKSGV